MLPSLFGACNEEPYQPGGRGFASWPKTRWWWGSALARHPGIYALKLHHGKLLFLSTETMTLVDPLCRQELACARQGLYGPACAEFVGFLAAAGPSVVEDVKRELGLDTTLLRTMRQRLERVGAVVGCTVAVTTKGGGGGATGRHRLLVFVATPP